MRSAAGLALVLLSTLSSPPAALASLGDVTFESCMASAGRSTFSSGESGVTYECALDRRAFRACSSPKRVVARKRGRHTFPVRAVDAAGNADPTPAKRTWKRRGR